MGGNRWVGQDVHFAYLLLTSAPLAIESWITTVELSVIFVVFAQSAELEPRYGRSGPRAPSASVKRKICIRARNPRVILKRLRTPTSPAAKPLQQTPQTRVILVSNARGRNNASRPIIGYWGWGEEVGWGCVELLAREGRCEKKGEGGGEGRGGDGGVMLLGGIY